MGFIYTITCNNKLYVGSTTRTLNKRWGDHKSSLRTQKHSNIHLQRAWNLYGEESFIFEMIEECDNSIVLSIEQFWINILNVYQIGYNRNPTAGSSIGIKRSKEACENIGKTGNWKKANAAWKGSKHTDEVKKVIKYRRSLQVLEPWTDKRRAEASIKQREIAKDRNFNYNRSDGYLNIVAYNNGETLYFANTHEAKIYFSLGNVNGITRVLRGERSFYRGYRWKVLLKSGELMESPVEDNHEPS